MNNYSNDANAQHIPPYPQHPEYPSYQQPSQPMQPATAYPSYVQPTEGTYTAQPSQPYPPYQPSVQVQPPTPKRGRFSFKSLLKYGAVALIFFIIGMNVGQTSAKQAATDSTTTSTSQAIATTPAKQAATVVPTKPPLPTPTPKPTPAPKWTTTHTFTGNGIKKTAVFTVPADWKVLWSCTPSSFYGGQYNIILSVYNSDGTPADIAVNTICKAGNTGDVTEEHQGGDVYLDINSEGAWTIQVQELK